MRPASVVLLALLAVSACATSNWSGAPSPTAASTSDQSSAVSSEPTASLAPAAVALAKCDGAPQPTGGPLRLALTVTEGVFDTKVLEGSRHCEAFTLTFHNMDGREPHNFAVSLKGSVFSQVFRSDPFYGPAHVDYAIPPLPAGVYDFSCPVHLSIMQGSLVVSAP